MVKVGDSFEAMQSTKPRSSYSACRIVVTSMKNATKAKLLPRFFTPKQGIISYKSTVYSQSSWPFRPGQSTVKVLPFDDSIRFWKFGRSNLIGIERQTSFFGILSPTFFEFFPLTTVKVKIYLSSSFLDMLSS
jgi:hypothetical protein